MSRILASKYFCLLLLLLAATQLQARETHLIVLHTNDVHSRIEPHDASSRYAGKGGVLRREVAIRQIRQEAKDCGAQVLLLDAGDFVQGTPYFNLFHGKVEVELMNRLAYDAATLGNHEFDCGIDALAKMLRKADFPIVNCNYDLTDTPLAKMVQPYIVLRKGPLKIGIVAVGVNLQNLVIPSKREGWVYRDAIVQAESCAALLKEQGCDLVVCLSHLGYSSRGACDIELAENSRHIDLIIGGHSHTFLKAPKTFTNLDGRPVLVTQMGKDGIYLGRIDLMIEQK